MFKRETGETVTTSPVEAFEEPKVRKTRTVKPKVVETKVDDTLPLTKVLNELKRTKQFLTESLVAVNTMEEELKALDSSLTAFKNNFSELAKIKI